MNKLLVMIENFRSILQRELQPDVWEWLNTVAGRLATKEGKAVLFNAFTAMPRRTGKRPVVFTVDDMQELSRPDSAFAFKNYTIDRLARVWLLLSFPDEDRTLYVNAISELFRSAEMNEQVALFGALNMLSYPEEWIKQCTEGIRSNIGLVLEAIMCDNPYPSANLTESAWNQLVLKAFFTEKPVNRIIGLDERANRTLAFILSDYAHERWAAGRKVDPLLWRLTAKFIDDRLFEDLKKVFEHGDKA